MFLVVAACGPGDHADIPVPPDANTLPPGVWEPDPGTGRLDAIAVTSGDSVWFAYRRVPNAGDGYWLTKTTTDGQPIVAPVKFDANVFYRTRAIAATDSSVVLASADRNESTVLVRRFDQAGLESSRVTIELGEPLYGPMSLVAKPSGEAKLVVAGNVHEIVAIDVDGASTPTTVGMRVPRYQASRVAATFAPDGELVVGWDLVYERCYDFEPFTAHTAVVHGDGVAEAPSVLRDLPDHSEYAPALSPSFAAWQQDDDVTHVNATIAVAALGDLGTVYEVADPEESFNYQPLLAEESPGRAAIAWLGDHGRYIAALVRDASGVRVGVVRDIPKVHPSARPTIDALLSIGNGRYLVTWSETIDTPSFGPDARQYAMTFDLSNDPSPRVARPARTMPARPRGMHRIAPCL